MYAYSMEGQPMPIVDHIQIKPFTRENIMMAQSKGLISYTTMAELIKKLIQMSVPDKKNLGK